MPAAPAGYTKFLDSLASGLVDLHTDSLKAMLLSAYTVGTTQDDAQFVADITAVATQAPATGGYALGGKLLTGVTWTRSGAVWTLDCDDILWATSTIDAAFALFYDDTPTDPTAKPIVGYWDFGGTNSSAGTDFKLTVNASGLFTFTNVI